MTNFPKFTVTPITKMEQEIGYACITILQMQRRLHRNSTTKRLTFNYIIG